MNFIPDLPPRTLTIINQPLEPEQLRYRLPYYGHQDHLDYNAPYYYHRVSAQKHVLRLPSDGTVADQDWHHLTNNVSVA